MLTQISRSEKKKSISYSLNQSQDAIMHACAKTNNSKINWKKRQHLHIYKHYKLAGKNNKSVVREVMLKKLLQKKFICNTKFIFYTYLCIFFISFVLWGQYYMHIIFQLQKVTLYLDSSSKRSGHSIKLHELHPDMLRQHSWREHLAAFP